MTLHLYNTLSRRKEEFTPIDPDRITMYVCGPTVYSYPHIGNARPAVVFDVLLKLLRHQWPKVLFARNITDIDDKITAAAVTEGVEISDISARFETIYLKDMAALGVEPPDISPHATDHVSDMIEMIQLLISNGHAYNAEGHVLFHVPSFNAYGKLARHRRDELIAGARVDVAPYKKDPSDFILWKPSTAEMPGWESPWGRGRPGWHLECSSMIKKHLGKTIDIHGGGVDLVFPHHENEIAQSTCAHDGETFVQYWLHNGFVNVAQEKMSKSIGNVLLVNDLLNDAPGEAIRLTLLSAHYRQPLDWTDSSLERARRMLDRLYGSIRNIDIADLQESIDPDQAFIEALNDDLNTPKALAALFELSRQINTTRSLLTKKRLKATLLGSAALMGLLKEDPEDWFAGAANKRHNLTNIQIEELIGNRNKARDVRDFEEADRIRDLLGEEGILLDDSQLGTKWRRAR